MRDEERESILAQRYSVIRDSLAVLLQSYQWDYFYTATFRRPCASARLAINRIVTQTDFFTADRLFVAAEPHYLGSYHCHGLVHWPDVYAPDPNWLAHRFEASRGWSRFENARSLEHVSSYCAKYLTKELADWDFKGTGWQTWKRWPPKALDNEGRLL